MFKTIKRENYNESYKNCLTIKYCVLTTDYSLQI